MAIYLAVSSSIAAQEIKTALEQFLEEKVILVPFSVTLNDVIKKASNQIQWLLENENFRPPSQKNPGQFMDSTESVEIALNQAPVNAAHMMVQRLKEQFGEDINAVAVVLGINFSTAEHSFDGVTVQINNAATCEDNFVNALKTLQPSITM